MARIGSLGINENLCSWSSSDGKFELYQQGEEKLVHFMSMCPQINCIRLKHYLTLEEKLKELNIECVFWSFMGASLLSKRCLFLGDQASCYGGEIEALFDLTCKWILVKAWHFRR